MIMGVVTNCLSCTAGGTSFINRKVPSAVEGEGFFCGLQTIEQSISMSLVFELKPRTMLSLYNMLRTCI